MECAIECILSTNKYKKSMHLCKINRKTSAILNRIKSYGYDLKRSLVISRSFVDCVSFLACRWERVSGRNSVWLRLLLQHTGQLQVCVSLWLWLWAEQRWLPRCEWMFHRHQPLYLRLLQYRWRLPVWLSWRFLQSWTRVREQSSGAGIP